MRSAEFWRCAEGKSKSRRMDCEACSVTGITPFWAVRALVAFWPSVSHTARLAARLVAHLSLQPLQGLHSFPICCWLPACCLESPSMLRAELRGRGPSHGSLNWARQAAGWEESWRAELCWGNMPSKADSQRWGLSSEVARRCHVGSFCHSKIIRNWRGELLLIKPVDGELKWRRVFS